MLGGFEPALNLPPALAPPCDGGTLEGFSREDNRFYSLP